MSLRLTRRDFLNKGSKSMLAAATIPYFLKSHVNRAFAAPAAPDMTIRDYYDHFEVNANLIHDVMTTALSRGGDYCDIFFQHRIYNYVRLEDKAVNRASSTVDLGVGIRVLKGDQTGYSFTEEITPEAMKLAAETAANIADSGKGITPVGVMLHETPNYYPIEIPWEQVSIDEKIPYLETINDKVFASDPRIIKANVIFTNESSHIMIATSEGRIVADYQPMTMIYVSCTAEQDGQREQNMYNLSSRQGIEFFTPENMDRVVQEAVSRTTQLFSAGKPEAGEMEVVLAAGSSGILLHEAIGHGMEADFNRKEISIFSDKINKPVAEKFVSIVDDGTNPHVRGTINVDDEANDSQKTFLVQDGILRSYLHDRISSKFYGVQPTGSGRRESFRFAPQPRMRNTYMLPGPHTKEEIIGSIKKGLYADQFTNGQVLIGAGDFTFYVKLGALIEDGKITKPVKDINIIGNGPEVLSNIVMVADDFQMSEGSWTCGKNGQRVPVSLGLPTLKVSKITVGGMET